jgi:hypothetical protein
MIAAIVAAAVERSHHFGERAHHMSSDSSVALEKCRR